MDFDETKYIWKPCEICGIETNGRFMFDDFPVCPKCYETDELMEYLKNNRLELYRFEMSDGIEDE